MRSTSLLRDTDFLKLWAGQSISLAGTQVTSLALPLTAVLVLDATPAQMGVLGAVQTLPFLLVGLFAGVWVDRVRRRPILVGADLGRALLLATVPLAAALHRLTLAHLYAVGLLVGVLTVFFDIAYQSFLPSLVDRIRLIEGNSRLETSNAVARVAGPGLGGALVQFLSAPGAIVLDALSYLGSALFIIAIRRPEPSPTHDPARGGVWCQIGEGLRVVTHHRLLRPLALSTATSNFASGIVAAVFVFFLTRTLTLNPAAIGLTYAAGSIGGVLSALGAGRAAGRIGLGRAVTGGKAMIAASALLLPLVGGSTALVLSLLIVARASGSAGAVLANVAQVSLRQTITPDRLQGRVNATMRFLDWGTLPLGALMGGALGETIGIRPTLALAGLIMAAGLLLVLLSPLPTMNRLVTEAE